MSVTFIIEPAIAVVRDGPKPEPTAGFYSRGFLWQRTILIDQAPEIIDELRVGAEVHLTSLLSFPPNTGPGLNFKKGEILKAKKTAFLDVVRHAGPGLNCALSTLTIHMGVIDDSYLPFTDLIALIGATYAACDV